MPVVRDRPLGGGAAGDRGLSEAGPGSHLALLRPALEAAWAVARAGEIAIPTEPAPRALRRFLQFARLPDRALDVTRRVLEDDVVFRARVLGAVGEEDVGRAGWLFLARPDGWEDELAALEEAVVDEEVHARDLAEEREARRRLRGAEEARQRAEAALELARSEAGRLAVEVERERGSRRQAEADLAAAMDAVRKLTAEAGSSRATAARAQESRSVLEAEVARLQAELDRVTTELVAARRQLDEAAANVEADAVADAVGPTAGPVSGGEERDAGGAEPFRTVPEPGPDLTGAVRSAVAEAAAAAARLGDALAAAAAALGGVDHEVDPPVDDIEDPENAGFGAVGPELESGSEAADGRIGGRSRRAGFTGATSSRPARPDRAPAGLPPATFHDSTAAAEHLVRLNGVVVLVDGYNVSKLKWPELPIADQRRRLVDALGGLAARTGADIHAVFDGAEQVDASPPGGPRRLVRVTFSPPGVEADDVLIGMVETIPSHRPVVVVSSDRRVHDGAACRGANTISSSQLLDIL